MFELCSQKKDAAFGPTGHKHPVHQNKNLERDMMESTITKIVEANDFFFNVVRREWNA